MIACIAPSPKSHISLCVFLNSFSVPSEVLSPDWSPHFAPQTLNLQLRVVHFWKSAPWTYLSSVHHAIVSQLALQCDSHEDKLAMEHERKCSPCIVLALGSILCESPGLIPLLPPVLDPSTTDKLVSHIDDGKSHRTEGTHVPELPFECKQNQKIHLIRKACIMLLREGKTIMMMKIHNSLLLYLYST